MNLCNNKILEAVSKAPNGATSFFGSLSNEVLGAFVQRQIERQKYLNSLVKQTLTHT